MTTQTLKFHRRCPGLYDCGDWLICVTEGEDRAPGYEWCAQHPDKGEHFSRTLTEAKATVRRIEGKQ